MGGAVKAVKKVAPYVAAAVAMYYGGPYLTSAGTTAGGASYATMSANYLAAGTAAGAAAGAGISAGTLMSAGGLAMQGISSIQSMKYASQQSGYQRQQIEAKNKSDAARNKYNQLLQKRSRYQAIRAARIAQAQVGGGYGSAVGAGGTSGYVGSVGSLGTQASQNLGNINVAEDVGNQISRFNTMSANYGSQAAQAEAKSGGWQNVAVLGDSIFDNATKIFG
jgi:hypothetical protein